MVEFIRSFGIGTYMNEQMEAVQSVPMGLFISKDPAHDGV